MKKQKQQTHTYVTGIAHRKMSAVFVIVVARVVVFSTSNCQPCTTCFSRTHSHTHLLKLQFYFHPTERKRDMCCLVFHLQVSADRAPVFRKFTFAKVFRFTFCFHSVWAKLKLTYLNGESV